MKAYVITSGVIFALVFLAHLARMIAEGGHLARDPGFFFLTLLAAGLSFWSILVLRRLSKK
jgi:hypothetical protein